MSGQSISEMVLGIVRNKQCADAITPIIRERITDLEGTALRSFGGRECGELDNKESREFCQLLKTVIHSIVIGYSKIAYNLLTDMPMSCNPEDISIIGDGFESIIKSRSVEVAFLEGVGDASKNNGVPEYEVFNIAGVLWHNDTLKEKARQKLKVTGAADAKWKKPNELKEAVRAEYLRDKEKYRGKTDFVNVRYSALVIGHGLQRREGEADSGLMPSRKRFYDEWLKGL